MKPRVCHSGRITAHPTVPRSRKAGSLESRKKGSITAHPTLARQGDRTWQGRRGLLTHSPPSRRVPTPWGGGWGWEQGRTVRPTDTKRAAPSVRGSPRESPVSPQDQPGPALPRPSPLLPGPVGLFQLQGSETQASSGLVPRAPAVTKLHPARLTGHKSASQLWRPEVQGHSVAGRVPSEGQDRCPGPLSLALGRPSCPCVCTWRSLGQVCVQKSSQDVCHVGLGPPHTASFYLNFFFKTLRLNTFSELALQHVNFFVLGGGYRSGPTSFPDEDAHRPSSSGPQQTAACGRCPCVSPRPPRPPMNSNTLSPFRNLSL